METLKIDLEQDEVFVFTPKGKVDHAPAGATPVDFAYTIHTEVGHRCIGARVNGRLVPLDSTLSPATPSRSSPARSRVPGPSRDWLQFVQTRRRQQQDPPVVLARAPRRRDRDRARRARQGAAQGGAARSRSSRSPRSSRRSPSRCTTRTSTRSTPRSAKATSPLAPWPSACTVSCAGGEEQLPITAQRRTALGPCRAGRAASAYTSKGSTTSWCACPAAARRCRATRSWVSSPVAAACRCTGPTARTPASLVDSGAPGHRGRVGPRRDRRRSSCRSRSRRSTGPGCCATSPRCWPSTTSTSCRARRRRRATGSHASASTSSSPTPATSTRSSRRSSASTPCTRRTAVLPGAAARASSPRLRRPFGRRGQRFFYAGRVADARSIRYRAPIGTHDVLPPESDRWVDVCRAFADAAARFGYGLVVTPVFEHVEVFQRVGASTDVVRKEMYEFTDEGAGDSRSGRRAPRRSCGRTCSTDPRRRGRSGTWRRTSGTSDRRRAGTASTGSSAPRCSASTTPTSTSR